MSEKGGNGDMKKRKGLLKRLFAAVLAISLVAGNVDLTAFAAEPAVSVVVDADTSKTYEDDNFLGHEYSTEFAGRIWTDKTVTAAADNNFTIKYSALATSKAVTGQTNAPVDVVFVIDTSGSMLDPMSSTDNTRRIVATVAALNDSIDAVMEMNDYTRVAVVAFSNQSSVILPLGRYEKGTRTTGNGPNATTITNYFSATANSQSGTLYKHVIPEGGSAQSQQTSNRTVTGGTNIQRGYYEGLNVLASRTDTVANVNGTNINRVPAMIFLSDGAPTYSSGSDSWWAPANNNDDGPGSNPSGNSYYIGNGFKALMTAAYMKEAVNRTYAYDVSIYSVGMGISHLQDAEKNLAYVTLAPNDNWNANNNVARDFRSAWATYITNNGTPRINVGDSNGWTYSNDYYTVSHPTGTAAQYDIDTNVDALRTLVTDYYDADDADTVVNVFNQLVSEIALNAPEVPTEVKMGETLATGGHLTYTDPIGHYMEIKGTTMNFKFHGTTYTVSDADRNGVFTFDNDPTEKGSDEQDHKLNLIAIKVTTDANGFQTLTVDIPAVLIPLRVNQITLNAQGQVTTHTHNGEMPCELTYTVGMISDVYDENTQSVHMVPMDAQGTPWTGAKLSAYQEYVKANTDVETGSVNFYTNLFTKTHKILNNFTGEEHTVGDAVVDFEPSHTNAFYYVQDKMYVYEDEALTTLTTDSSLQDNKTYYYKEVFYHEDDIETKAVKRTGLQLSTVRTVKEDGTGYWYREPGTVRKNKLQLFENQKNPNLTETAQDYYASEFITENGEADIDGHFEVHLGNNGVLRASVTGNLTIKKVVTAAEGLTAPDKEFTFHVTLTGADGSYNYRILDATGTRIDGGTITNGAGTFVLKAGYTAEIANLPDGASYTITEDAEAGFTPSASGATGTIVAGSTQNAVFTNHYTATSVIVNKENTTADFDLKKVLENRAANDQDKFTFIMESHRATTPMPSGATPVPNATNPTHFLSEVTIGKDKINADANGTAKFGFGPIEYKAPGTYTYTISEHVPAEGALGITFSAAMYQVVVTIEDNGAGALTKDVKMYRLRTDAGVVALQEEGVLVNDNTATFTNTFSLNVEEVGWTPVGTKDYTDNSGTNSLKNGMFEFKIEALTPNAPMPTNNIVKNVGTQIPYNVITFGRQHVASTEGQKTVYEYALTEVIPTEAQPIPGKDGFRSLNGMTYDGRTRTVKVSVWYENVDGEAKLQVSPVYDTYVDEQHYDRAVFFNEYKTTPITLGQNGVATIDVVKTLSGRNWKSGDKFEFVLGAEDAATEAAISSGTITGVDKTNMKSLAKVDATSANVSFTGITFAKPGTYHFTISETKGTLGGMTYDAHVAKVKVEVKDTDTNNDGFMDDKLTVTVTYDNSAAITEADRTVTNKATFTNSYRADVSNAISLTGTKKLTGRDMKAGEFFLNIEPQLISGSTTEYAPMGNSHPGNAAPAAQDGVESAPITLLNQVTYVKEGTYQYLIKEHVPADEQKHGGIKYDENTVYRVTVAVTDNLEGKLVATAAVEKSTDKGVTWDPVTQDAIKFHNQYAVNSIAYDPVHLWKQLQGRDLAAGEFTFKVVEVKDDVDGMTLPNVTEVANQASGEIVFDKITFTKAGVYQVKVTEVVPTAPKAGVTYTDNELIVQFDVTDNGYGELEVKRSIVSGNIIFINIYETMGRLEGATNLKVQKEFTGRENNEWLKNDKFSFTLVPADDATKAGIADGSIDMNAEENGTPDKVTITIADAKEALGKAFGDIVFTKQSVYTFNLYEEATHPDTGKAIENVTYDKAIRTVTITAEDNGDGTMEVTAVITGGTLVFKNSFAKPSLPVPQPETPNTPQQSVAQPSAPKTGDGASAAMWSTLTFASIMVCGAILIIEKKRKGEI